MLENIEFEVIKEHWNKYKLKDDTIFLAKLVLVKIAKDENGYSFNHTPVFGAVAPPEKKGETSPGEPSIIEYDMDYDIIEENWNEYNLSDGMKLLAKIQITQINKTNKLSKQNFYILAICISYPKLPGLC